MRTLIENCAKTKQRSLFIVVGDRGKYQVVNLHYMLTKAQVKTKPSVLWCYNKDLGFSTYVLWSAGLSVKPSTSHAEFVCAAIDRSVCVR